mgnify:CR=1 FL=1
MSKQIYEVIRVTEKGGVEMSLTGKYASQDGNMNTHKDEIKAGNKVARVAKRVKEYLKSSLKNGAIWSK